MERGTLSPRELEILKLAAKGKTHITNLKSKMNASNVAHAVARGYELGLIDLRTAERRVMMGLDAVAGDHPLTEAEAP
jgi:hypothetical protein